MLLRNNQCQSSGILLLQTHADSDNSTRTGSLRAWKKIWQATEEFGEQKQQGSDRVGFLAVFGLPGNLFTGLTRCTCLRAAANASIAAASFPGVLAASCDTALAINISEAPDQTKEKKTLKLTQTSTANITIQCVIKTTARHQPTLCSNHKNPQNSISTIQIVLTK